jgi:hypothetical protein
MFPLVTYSLSILLHSFGVAARASPPHRSHPALELAPAQKSADAHEPPSHAALPLSTIAYRIVLVTVMQVGGVGLLRGKRYRCWVGGDDGSVVKADLEMISLI